LLKNEYQFTRECVAWWWWRWWTCEAFRYIVFII